MADPPARKGQKPIWYVVGCIGFALFFGVPCIGVLAAIAIPAFLNYTRRAKTAEARANIAMIRSGIEAACTDAGALPSAIGPTLTTPSATRQAPTLGPEWSAYGLAGTDGMYYAYSIERPYGATVRIVAEGDLDGDGTRSRFEQRCTSSGGSAGCSCDEVVVTNELE
jgi:type II secretory pathway pseudopilin PulG